MSWFSHSFLHPVETPTFVLLVIAKCFYQLVIRVGAGVFKSRGHQAHPAIVVKPKQPFLDWLHAIDSTSSDLTLQELVLEPAIYLIPECDTPEELADVPHELCEEIFWPEMV